MSQLQPTAARPDPNRLGDVKNNWHFRSTRTVGGTTRVSMAPNLALLMIFEDLYGLDYEPEVVGSGLDVREAIDDAMHKAAFRQHEVAHKARVKYGD